MKKIIMMIAAFLLISAAVLAVTVDRSMPSRVDPSSAFTVSFTVNPEGSLTAFDLADFIPSGWDMNDWSVSGYSKSDITYESQARNYQDKIRNALHWKFNKPLSSVATLSYTIAAPASTGTYDFIAIWTYPGGFNSKSSSLNVAPQPAPAPTPTPAPSPAPAPEEQPAPTPTPAPSPAPGIDMTTIAGLVILLVIIAAYFVYFRPKK